MKKTSKSLLLCLSLAIINVTQINAIDLKSLIMSALVFTTSAQTTPTNCPTAVPSMRQNATNNYPTPAPSVRASRCPACDRSVNVPTAITGARILRQMTTEQKGL